MFYDNRVVLHISNVSVLVYLVAIYRYLRVESEEVPGQVVKSNEIFNVMLQRFCQSLRKHSPHFFGKIAAQQAFLEKVMQLIHNVATARVDRKKKVSTLTVWVSH